MTKEEVFEQLGFSALEAEVYLALLKNGPNTAYRIGKLINKATANVYKAVDNLAAQGALEIEESDTRVCKAIPIDSVIAQLEKAYKKKLQKASALLSEVDKDSGQTGIYSLKTVEAVIQRAREMMGRCKQIAVLDLFPEPLKVLMPDIKKLAAKGKDVLLESYEDIKLDGISLVIPELSGQTLKHWKAQQLNIAIDGKEVLVALFNQDMSELIQANYSNNLYLSCIVYAGMKSEHELHLLSEAKTAEDINRLKKKHRSFVNTKVPGLDLLFKQYKN